MADQDAAAFFLCEATRFKLSLNNAGRPANVLPRELNGRWVALVAAENDRHIAAIAELQRDLAYARDDLKMFEFACTYCANPDIENPWRHEHPPKGAHWHHRIDPGDGLADDCKHSDRLEEIFGELSEALRLSVELQSHYAKLLNMHDGGTRRTFDTADEWIARLDEIKANRVPASTPDPNPNPAGGDIKSPSEKD